MWRGRLLPLIFVSVGAGSIASALTADPPARPPRKVAVLVGPSTYLHDFSPLNYTARDVTALADVLRTAGFDAVEVLTEPPEGKAPATRANVLARIDALLTKNANPADNVRQGDVVLIALSGHGQELDGPDPANPGRTRRDTYFAPVDGRKGKPDTLLSLSHLVDEVLAPCGGRNLLLVDACRDVYDPNKGKGIGGKHVSLSGQTAVLFSCSTAERSWEADDLRHGVFTHAVLEALRGARAAGRELTWTGLAASVESTMASAEYRRRIPAGQTQTPVLASGQVPSTILYASHVTAKVATTGARPLTGDNTPEAVRAAQKAWAQYLKVPADEVIDLGHGVRLEFSLIPPGTFWMGSPWSEENREANEAQHEVSISKPFYLGKFEITQAQYQAVTGSQLSRFSTVGERRNQVVGMETGRFPVEGVTWSDAVRFCEQLSRAGRGYRLPTEAEWEYGCRGGAYGRGSTPFCLENGTANRLTQDAANFAESRLTRPAPVGSYRPNPLGLYDLHGNVWEWCADWHGNFAAGPVTDPTGPVQGQARVIRGGGWINAGGRCRAAMRGYVEPTERGADLGFRVARSIEP